MSGAEEAAREQAGEAAGRSQRPRLTRRQRPKARGSREQDRAGREGEAAATAEEPAGERPLAAAPGDAPLETDIREKPEPGEESGPPRQEAPAAAQPRIGRSAIGPKSSLSEGTSFLGADSNDSGFIPPDSMGAVGPTQILVSVNGRVRLFDKQGNPDPDLDVTDSAFWDPVLPTGVEPTDPGVEYDRISERWIVSAIDTQNTDNQVMFAVSDGPTITDETSFDVLRLRRVGPTRGAAALRRLPAAGRRCERDLHRRQRIHQQQRLVHGDEPLRDPEIERA